MSDALMNVLSREIAPRTPLSAAPQMNAKPTGSETRHEQPVDTFEPTTDEGDGAEMQQMCMLRQMAQGKSAPQCQTAAQSGFAYDPVALLDLSEAPAWAPGADGVSGTDANAAINNTYDKLDKDMSRYLGEPAVASWMTFGKYASREAGEQIRNLENVERAQSGDTDAARAAARDMAHEAPLEQAARLGFDTLRRTYEGDGKVLDDTLPNVFGKLGKMRDALVEGNVAIYQNIAPAYDAFLRGEADASKGGMQALKEAGYEKGSPRDPQGFVTAAFERYSQARQKGIEADETSDPTRRQQLLDERKALMNEGNLQIGLQEQMTILQRDSIYGDPQMQEALEAVGGTMSLTDANGRHDLRPDGKSWAGFADRMGLMPTTADDARGIDVTDHHGRTTRYAPDPTQTGTIYEYFTTNVDGDAARNLIESAPRPL